MNYERLDRLCWHLPWRWTRRYRRWRMAQRIDALTPEQRRVLDQRLKMMVFVAQNSSVTIEDAAQNLARAGRELRQ